MTGRTFYLVAVTAAAALPLVALGALQFAGGATDPLLGLALFVGIVALSVRPIHLRPYTDLSLSDVFVLAGVVMLPLVAVAPIAAAARVLNDAVLRRSATHLIRNASAAALSCGIASIVYAAVVDLVPGPGRMATIPGAVAAAVTLVLVDVAQLLALLRGVPGVHAEIRWRAVWHTTRAQLLWALAVVMVIEIGRIEPFILIPAIPLLLLGYQDIRARFIAERRSRVLATLMEVSHAVGASLDPTTVFRAVYKSVRASLESDAFYVALLSANGTMVSYRFLVDENLELPPQDRAKYGTLAGVCIDEDRAILMRDALRDYQSLGIERSPWGTVAERSIMVAPLRIRGKPVGAISAQSVNANAYDEGDLELLGAIANEAAVAIERAELYERTAALSRRLVELHRIGLELGAEREIGTLARRLAESVMAIIGSSAAAVYLDNGGDSLEFAATTGKETSDYTRLPKSQPLIARALEEGSVEIADSRDVEPAETRRLMEERGHRAVLIYALRAAKEGLGILFVTWPEPHRMTSEERELIDLLGGIGATALRSIRLYAELDEAYLATVQTLMTTIQARDGYREDHQRRVAADTVALGERLKLPEASLRDLRYASLFHALGKIGIAPSILSKQGPLTNEERRVVREHPILGARIIESIRFLRGVMPIVRHANERWDGSGYPDGLAFEAIPYEARLLQVVLTYHAMLAERPYRRGLEPRIALGELRLLAGSRYDPGLVDEFVAMIEERGGVEFAREVQEGARELAILAEITPQFNTLLDLKQLLDRVLRSLERHWPDSRIHILLRDEHTEELVVRAVAGQEGTLAAGVRLARGHGLASWVLEHREPLNVEDIREDPRAPQQDEAARAQMLTPLINEARAIGVLVVSSRHIGAFSQRDLTLLQAVGAQIAAAIEVADLHERLKRAVNTDALTGLHNFRYFYDRLEEEIARAQRRGTPLAVAYFDIDGLKRVNDSHGHIAGDAVLRTLGSAIDSHVRTEDVPARYGGDEFAIVLPDTARDEAEKVVARLMELLDSSRIDLGDERSIPMPARSWGVSSYPTDGTTAKELVENADARAYARKRAKA